MCMALLNLTEFSSYFMFPTKFKLLWKDRVFAIPATACWLGRCGTDLCANLNWWLHLLCPLSFISNLFWRLSNKLMQLVAGCVMEGSMMFCQKNILGHSMMFHGDYKKRCLRNHGQSDIVTHKTNIWNKEYLYRCKRTILLTFPIFSKFYQKFLNSNKISLIFIQNLRNLITGMYDKTFFEVVFRTVVSVSLSVTFTREN